MRRSTLYAMILVLSATTLGLPAAHSKQIPKGKKIVDDEMRGVRPYTSPTGNTSDVSFEGLRVSAVADTTILAHYDFETGPQGWVPVDMTEQPGRYWHVDDYAGLGGGSFGLLTPVRGNQSLWRV
jgi:hypothetical protein